MSYKSEDRNEELVRIGAELRRARAIAGMTMDDAAEATGIHRASISAIENGAREIKILHFLSLVQAYDADVNAILGIEAKQTRHLIPARLVLNDGRVYITYIDTDTIAMLDTVEEADAHDYYDENDFYPIMPAFTDIAR